MREKISDMALSVVGGKVSFILPLRPLQRGNRFSFSENLNECLKIKILSQQHFYVAETGLKTPPWEGDKGGGCGKIILSYVNFSSSKILMK
jgi:hypothetical protein